MKVTACIVLAVAGVASSGCAATLHRTAQVTEVATYPSLACDGLSTRAAIATGDHYETNPMIAGRPSDGALVAYFGTVGAAVFTANHLAATLLEERPVTADLLRIALNLGVLAVEVDSVRHNREQGIPTCGL